MRVTKSLFFILAALVGIFALSTSVIASENPCTDPDKVKFKDGASCVVDLNGKWNELVIALTYANNQLHVASDNVESACSDLGFEDACDDGSVSEPDFYSASAYAADALEDVGIAQLRIAEAVDIINDFNDLLAGLADKVDGAGTDYGFGDRNRSSVARTSALIARLLESALAALGDETAGTGLAGVLSGAAQDLSDAVSEMESESSDEDVAGSLLDSALNAVNKAELSKSLVMRKHLNQVRSALKKLASIFKIAQNNPKRASESLVALSSSQISVYTLSGQLISVGPAATLARNSLANGVYVVVHSNGRVEKLVVLH